MKHFLIIIFISTVGFLDLVEKRAARSCQLRYKTSMALIAFVFLMTSEVDAQQSVTNGDVFNYELQYYQLCAKVGDEIGNEEWTVKLAVEPGNNSTGSDLNPLVNGLCFQETDISVDCGALSYSTILAGSDQGPFVDIHFAGWEDDSSFSCTYDSDDDDLFSQKILAIDIREIFGGPSHSEFAQYSVELIDEEPNPNVITMDILYLLNWRYHHGTFDSPLDFGMLNPGDQGSHSNSNLKKNIVPQGQAGSHFSGLNYTDFGVTYRFQVTKDVRAIITSTSTETKTKLQLFGNPTNPDNSVYEDPSSSVKSARINRVIPAGIYEIRVGKSDNGGQFDIGGLFNLQVTIVDLPINDKFEGAKELSVGNEVCQNSMTATNSLYTDSGVSHTCVYEGGDVWFKFVAPASGSVTIETTQEGNNFFDTVIEAYDLSGGNLTSIGCDDQGGENNFSKLELTGLISGRTYYLATWEYTGNVVGTFRICVYSGSDPCADGYTGANALSGSQTSAANFRTNQSIESTQVIGSTSSQSQISVLYSAGPMSNQYIELMPGFEVKENTIFIADLLGCDPN